MCVMFGLACAPTQYVNVFVRPRVGFFRSDKTAKLTHADKDHARLSRESISVVIAFAR